MVHVVSNYQCDGNYTNSLMYNKGYCITCVRHDSIRHYVNPIVIHTPLLNVEHVFVVQARSEAGRRYRR